MCHAYTRNFDTRGFAINGINLFRVLDYSNETIENFFFLRFHGEKTLSNPKFTIPPRYVFVRNTDTDTVGREKTIEDKISIDSLARFSASRSGREVYETSVSGLVPRNVPVFKQRGVGAAYHPLQFD